MLVNDAFAGPRLRGLIRTARPVAAACGLLLLVSCGGDTPKPKATGSRPGTSARTVDPDAAGDAAPRGSASSKRRGGKQAVDPKHIPDLASLRRAEEEPPAPDAPQRNLFAFEEDPVVVAERKRQEEEARKRAEEARKKAEEEERKRQEELRKNPPPPQPPPINFEFLGYFGNPQSRIGVFTPKGGGDVTLAVEGDKIFGSYHVKEIGFESAEIGFDNFKETKRIPISASSEKSSGGK